MTKRFVVEKYSVRDMSIDEKYVNGSYHIGDKGIAQSLCDLLNALHEENVELKNSLKGFEVFESNRIKGAVVTNDDFSVTLHNNNEAYMVCNMLNRFIGSVKNGSKD